MKRSAYASSSDLSKQPKRTSHAIRLSTPREPDDATLEEDAHERALALTDRVIALQAQRIDVSPRMPTVLVPGLSS